MIKENPYQILGVAANADEREIRAAYFKLVRLHPPESQPERFKRIRSAYESLVSVKKRAETDVSVLQPPDFVYEIIPTPADAFLNGSAYDRLLTVCLDLFHEKGCVDFSADFLDATELDHAD